MNINDIKVQQRMDEICRSKDTTTREGCQQYNVCMGANPACEVQWEKEQEAKKTLGHSCEQIEASMKKTPHQQRIELFMQNAQQDLPKHPTMPNEKTRLLRAKLIYEECMETISLGLGVVVRCCNLHGIAQKTDFIISPTTKPNLVEIADGCADVSVVTVGTLSACGISDKALLEEVDRSNLSKFIEPECPHHGKTMLHSYKGQYRCTTMIPSGSNLSLDRCGRQEKGPYRDEAGKWQKGPQYSLADIKKVLSDQMPKVENPKELLSLLAYITGFIKDEKPRHQAIEIIGKLEKIHEKFDDSNTGKCASSSHADHTPEEVGKAIKTIENYYGPLGWTLVKGEKECQSLMGTSPQEIDTFDPTQNKSGILAKDAEWVAHKKSGQVAPSARTGDPSSGVLGPQPSMTLCGNCKTPLSQNLVRKVRNPRYESDTYICPECQKNLSDVGMVQAD